jgi:hypothetical protein
VDQDITDEIKATGKEIERVKSVYRRDRQRGAYFWIVFVAWAVVSPGLAILVSRQISIDAARRATEISERKLCDIVVTADDGYRRRPPTSETLKAQAANMAKLRAEYHCPQGVRR